MPKALIYVIDTAKRDEYPTLKNFLMKGGYEVSVAVGSRDVNVNYTVDLMTLPSDKLSALFEEYDAFALVGGFKMYYHVLQKKPPLKTWDLNIDKERLAQLVVEFNKRGKLLIAPMAVPAYVAQLGLLSGRDATVYPVTELIKILRDNKANFVNRQIVRSRNIITVKDITTTSEKEFLTILREAG